MPLILTTLVMSSVLWTATRRPGTMTRPPDTITNGAEINHEQAEVFDFRVSLLKTRWI
jgi:hypothetical protein